MLKIIIHHEKNQPYMVDIECSKPIRNTGSNIVPHPYDIVDMIEDAIHEYRS